MDELFALSQQEDYGRQAKADRHRNKLLAPMHRAYGRTEGKICGDCVHLLRVSYSKTYIKCGLGPQSHGPGTDWRARWPACGRFDDGTSEPKETSK